MNQYTTVALEAGPEVTRIDPCALTATIKQLKEDRTSLKKREYTPIMERYLKGTSRARIEEAIAKMLFEKTNKVVLFHEKAGASPGTHYHRDYFLGRPLSSFALDYTALEEVMPHNSMRDWSLIQIIRAQLPEGYHCYHAYATGILGDSHNDYFIVIYRGCEPQCRRLLDFSYNDYYYAVVGLSKLCLAPCFCPCLFV